MNTPSLCLRLGQAYLSGQPSNYAAARKAFRAAINIAPEWGEPYYLLGLAYQRQGKVHQAVEAYERAIARNSGPHALIALGWMKRLLGDFSTALDRLHAALALNCCDLEAEVRLMLAECYECSGQTEEAVDQWHMVVSMRPVFPSGEQAEEVARASLGRYGRIGVTYKTQRVRAAVPSLARRRGRMPARNMQVRNGT